MQSMTINRTLPCNHGPSLCYLQATRVYTQCTDVRAATAEWPDQSSEADVTPV